MNARIPSLGILGAGQLAAMLTVAANRLGIDVHVFRSSDSQDRCSANQITTASYDDAAALQKFAASVDVVTIETENIPVATLQLLEDVITVHPSPKTVEISQERLLEKQFLTNNGIKTARYAQVDSVTDLRNQIAYCGGRGILKSRRFGYDGKGQTRIDHVNDVESAWNRHGECPSILEEFVPFDFEISVIAARSESGEIVMYDPGRNEHRKGILHKTEVPARLDPDLENRALRIARSILDALDYVGVIGVEFFVVGSELLVNEIAPRVHNSGHWTQEGCAVDQFEQHVRAVVGHPLGSTARHCDVITTNIMGSDVNRLDSLLRANGDRIHLYGKREARPDRKMGHINSVQPC